jgi:hypothetical protein
VDEEPTAAAAHESGGWCQKGGAGDAKTLGLKKAGGVCREQHGCEFY